MICGMCGHPEDDHMEMDPGPFGEIQIFCAYDRKDPDYPPVGLMGCWCIEEVFE